MAQYTPERALDSNGDTLLANLYIYTAGTTTPVTIYSDAALTTPTAFPLPSDASGAWADVYVAAGSYKVDIKDTGGSSLPGYPKDNIKIGEVSTTGDTMTGQLVVKSSVSIQPTSGNAYLHMRRPSASNTSSIWFYSATDYMLWDVTAELASSGGDFSISAGDGAGGYNGTPFKLDRGVGTTVLTPYGTASDWAITVNYSAATTFYVENDGDVYNTNGTYGTISDAAWKENITDATPKLDDINSLRVVNYYLTEDHRPEGEPATKLLGFVAQEVERVFPGLVDTAPGGTKTVKTSILVPMLVKAIQELTARVEALEP